MLGAIIGDIVGSQFEHGNRVDGTPMKYYDFPLFTERCRYTDDTVCTLAVAEALLHPERLSFKASLINWCRRYPQAGYGPSFKQWFLSADPTPYDSYGNGSAMRVSPVGFIDMEASDALTGHLVNKDVREAPQRVLDIAKASAVPSHGHEEGIKGAQAVAAAVWLARHTTNKSDILRYIEEKFGYDLRTSLAEIRPTYGFDVTCQGSVPQAIRCFLEARNFEDCIRLAASLGGDSDTQAAIAGGIAQAYYKKIPERMVWEAFSRMPSHMVDVVLQFHQKFDVPF